MRIPVEISPGELFDKLTILEIKANRIDDSAKLGNVRREWAVLGAAARQLGTSPELVALKARLRLVNEKLWEIEDQIRGHERVGDFGTDFVELARAVYLTNDRRAALKKEINDLLKSDIAEEKSYADY